MSDDMSEQCKWLHEQLEQLPLVRFPFALKSLPKNGIYFFYEKGEFWGHGGNKPRIVRVGTHKDGNFGNRIAEHYLMNESKMNFSSNQPAPHERSIFRAHMGRALLNQHRDGYLKIWKIDFTSREKREKLGYLRDINKEKEIESEITRILRNNFTFRFIELESQAERMGKTGIESPIIGTLAHCRLCRPSANWLGNYSPIQQIRKSGLWLVQHLKSGGIDERDLNTILDAIKRNKSHSSIYFP